MTGKAIEASQLHGMQVDEYASALKEAGVEEMLEKVENKGVKYPDYYLQKFHVRFALLSSPPQSPVYQHPAW